MTRMFNMFSPIPLNLDQSPGRQLLFASGYDTRLSTYFSPDGDNLSKEPELRSLFQAALGQQNLELKLNRLAKDPKVIASIAEMNRIINSGDRGNYEAMDFHHNIKIDRIFTLARRRAWASIMNDPRIQVLQQEARMTKARRYRKKKETQRSVSPILNMYK